MRQLAAKSIRMDSCRPPGMLAALFPASSQTVRVDITPGHAVNSFVPTEALGAGIDRIDTVSTDKVFAEPVMRQVLSAGWNSCHLSPEYRTPRGGLALEPAGAWSDPAGKGYFVGNAKPGDFIRHSFGYGSPIAASPATTAPTPTVFHGSPMATRDLLEE